MKKARVCLQYFQKHKKEYIFFLIAFAIGMILGIFFIRNGNSEETANRNKYIQDLIVNIKNSNGINYLVLLVESIKNNSYIILMIWCLGCTIIGSFLIYLAILYKGFSFGYTIAAIFTSLGTKSGICFVGITMILQNIILLPAIFLLASSGIQLYVNIKRNCVNLKVELLRHTIIMLISLIISVVASFIEVYVSTNLLIFLKDFL